MASDEPVCAECGSRNLDRDGDCLSCGHAYDEPVQPGVRNYELLRQLYVHLREATRLADELHDVLPIASPGRGYLEWEQLQWMADAVHDGTKGEQR